MPARVVVTLENATLARETVVALRAAGYESIMIPDPMEALDKLETAERIELLVTSGEFQPGKPNGVALARMVRTKRPDVNVVFMGTANFASLLEGLGLFVQMPVTPHEVVQAVGTLIKPDG